MPISTTQNIQIKINEYNEHLEKWCDTNGVEIIRLVPTFKLGTGDLDDLCFDKVNGKLPLVINRLGAVKLLDALNNRCPNFHLCSDWNTLKRNSIVSRNTTQKDNSHKQKTYTQHTVERTNHPTPRNNSIPSPPSTSRGVSPLPPPPLIPPYPWHSTRHPTPFVSAQGYSSQPPPGSIPSPPPPINYGFPPPPRSTPNTGHTTLVTHNGRSQQEGSYAASSAPACEASQRPPSAYLPRATPPYSQAPSHSATSGNEAGWGNGRRRSSTNSYAENRWRNNENSYVHNDVFTHPYEEVNRTRYENRPRNIFNQNYVRKTIGCFNCGEFNHAQKNCRFDHKVMCSICKRLGHKSRLCQSYSM